MRSATCGFCRHEGCTHLRRMTRDERRFVATLLERPRPGLDVDDIARLEFEFVRSRGDLPGRVDSTRRAPGFLPRNAQHVESLEPQHMGARNAQAKRQVAAPRFVAGMNGGQRRIVKGKVVESHRSASEGGGLPFCSVDHSPRSHQEEAFCSGPQTCMSTSGNVLSWAKAEVTSTPWMSAAIRRCFIRGRERSAAATCHREACDVPAGRGRVAFRAG